MNNIIILYTESKIAAQCFTPQHLLLDDTPYLCMNNTLQWFDPPQMIQDKNSMEIIYGHTNFKSQMLTIPLQPEFDMIDISDLVETPFNQTHFEKITTFFTNYDVVQASVFSGIGIIGAFLIIVLPCILIKFCRPTWLPKLYSATETLCCFCTKKYKDYRVSSKQEENEEIHQAVPSAPPLDTALPGPIPVPDQLLDKTPSAPPLAQSGAIHLSDDLDDQEQFRKRQHKNRHEIESDDTLIQIPLHKLRSEQKHARALWLQNNPTTQEHEFPSFLQRKYLQHGNYNKSISKKFQPTQYQIHTKSMDESFDEIE